MMYDEFARGTGCRDNEHNHKVFKDLEVLYMNSDLTKEEIYEYGKKLVDNSKSEEELALEAKINQEISDLKEQLKSVNSEIDYYKSEYEGWKDSVPTEGNKWWLDTCKTRIKYYKSEARVIRNKIRGLKWVLE